MTNNNNNRSNNKIILRIHSCKLKLAGVHALRQVVEPDLSLCAGIEDQLVEEGVLRPLEAHFIVARDLAAITPKSSDYLHSWHTHSTALIGNEVRPPNS